MGVGLGGSSQPLTSHCFFPCLSVVPSLPAKQAVEFTMVLGEGGMSTVQLQPPAEGHLGLQHVCPTVLQWQIPISFTISSMDPPGDGNAVPVPLGPSSRGDIAQCCQLCLPGKVAARRGCPPYQEGASGQLGPHGRRSGQLAELPAQTLPGWSLRASWLRLQVRHCW